MKTISKIQSIIKMVILVIATTSSFTVIGQDFSVSLFQLEMQKEMKKAFPYMDLDTGLYVMLKPDYRDYYPGRQTIQISYTNAEGDEHQMAVDAVSHYRVHLSKFFHEENLPTCKFAWFCAYADYSGSIIRYAIMIDNRLTIDHLVIDLEED